MATPSILRKLGSKAKATMPDQSDYEGLQEKKQMVDQATAKPEEKKEESSASAEPASWERVGKKYGSRPGEKTYSPEQMNEMTHPLGSGSPEVLHDDGGKVGSKTIGRAGRAGHSIKEYDSPEGTPTVGKPKINMSYVDVPTGRSMSDSEYNETHSDSAPPKIDGHAMDDAAVTSVVVHDDGGTVNPDSPKGNGGLNVDLNGDGQPDHQRALLSDGERVLTPKQNSQFEYEHPEVTATDGETGKTTVNEGPKGEGGLNIPSSERLTGLKPKLDPNSLAGQTIQKDKEKAAMSGDLVGLGTAVLNEKHLATDMNAEHQPGELSHHERLKDYDRRILEAMDKAATTNDPAFQEQADRLKLAKMEYEKMTPWGSPTNHPGPLGKIAHIASQIGQAAATPWFGTELQVIPGTNLYNSAKRGALGSALKSDTEARLQQEAEQNKLTIAETGKTPETKTYNDLLKQINPKTNKLYTHEEALEQVKGDEQQKEKEAYISDRIKNLGETRQQATEAYYTMRAGTKPPNAKEAELKNYLAAHGLQDTPENRDLARQEILKQETDIKQRTALPYAEQKIRLQNDLAEAKAAVDRADNKALARGEKLDELNLKEKERHNAVVKQIDSAQNALETSDTNMLAASIVPVLATMTETTAQGIKRLNPQELARFMPKSSGDARQWFEANYDKVVAGQIPEQYRQDLRELLKNLSTEEDKQNQSNLTDIKQTFGEGATVPVVNKSGRATTTKAAVAPEPQFRRDPNNPKVVQKSVDGGTTWK